MTIARTRVIETDVNSFLFELHSVSHESRVLPQIEMLCLVRYQGVDHEDIRTEIQATMEKEGMEEGREKHEAMEVLDPGCPAFSTPGCLGLRPAHGRGPWTPRVAGHLALGAWPPAWALPPGCPDPPDHACVH